MRITCRVVWSVIIIATISVGSPSVQRQAACLPVAKTTTQPAVDEAAIRPSLVTVHFKNASATEVYRSLFEQAGIEPSPFGFDLFEELERAGDSIPPVTINVDKVPFWQAFHELAEQTDVGVSEIGGRLEFSSNVGIAETNGKVSIEGPFMVVADNSRGPMINSLKVLVEPRIRVLAHANEAKITKALDINGDPVPQPADEGPIRVNARRRNAREFEESNDNAFDVSLRTPVPRAGTLRGTVKVIVEAAEQVIVIDDITPAKDAERKVNGERYLLSTLNPEPGIWTVLLTVYNPEAVAGRPTLDATLVDANGKAFTSNGEGSFSNGKRIDFHKRFQQPAGVGAPVKLTVMRAGGPAEFPIAKAKDAERVVDGRRFMINVHNPEPAEWNLALWAFNTDPPTPGFGIFDPVLLDAKGRALSQSGRTGSGRSEQQIQFYQGPDCGPPAKLSLRLPKGTREVEIPFSFGRSE